ncbi:MAG: hypothetical protein OXU20_26060, partial [Myxococcales bacterium]|nr:hypothetical protein [Myxococcales bacterium]
PFEEAADAVETGAGEARDGADQVVLARIIHELCIASLVLRLHTPFVALANTGSMWVGRRKAV